MTCTAVRETSEIRDGVALVPDPESWDALLQHSYDNRLFLSSIWQQTWWQHFGNGKARVLTSLDESGIPNAILPLQISNSDDRVLSLAGDFNVTDYMDALADKADAEEFLGALCRRAYDDLEWDAIELRHVPSTSALLRALESVASERGSECVIEDDQVCPVALLCSSWDGYLQMLSKKQRHEIRRKLRRAQEGADWSWRTAETQADLDRDLPIFFRLHEASGREKARFMTPEMREFFRDMARVLLQAGILRLSIFRRDGEDIATAMSFLYRDRYLLYNSGYDPARAAHSPGIAAVALAMQDAIEQKAIAFDFLSGDEPYKYQFGASNTHTCRVRVTRR